MAIFPADIPLSTRIKFQTRFCQSAIKGHGSSWLHVGYETPANVLNLLRVRGPSSDWSSSHLHLGLPSHKKARFGGLYVELTIRIIRNVCIYQILQCQEHNFIGRPCKLSGRGGTIIAAPPLWTSLLLSLPLSTEGNFHSCGDEFPVHN